jgi:glycosyltransferase involved in cell wall biosynthesis
VSLVSVIVPCFNAGVFLEPALRSILSQTYRELDVIVIDDGSTDGSVSRAQGIISDPRIRWFHQNNAGKPIALNVAISHAAGDYYLQQDADDLSDPSRIALLLKTIKEHPEVAAVFSGHNIIIEGKTMAPTFRAKSASQCRRDIDRMAMPAHDPTAMYRLSKVKGVQYDSALRVAHGVDYILRVGERHEMLVLGECLYSYRIHPSSLTKSDPVRRDMEVEEVRSRACARRGIPFVPKAHNRNRFLRRSRSSERDNGLAGHFALSVQDQRNRGLRWSSLYTGLQCARLHPADIQYLKAAFYAISPDWLRRRVPSYGP